MANPMRHAVLAGLRASVALGRTPVVVRRGDRTAALSAAPGSSLFATETPGEGIEQRVTSHDWLCEGRHYDFGSGPETPAEGDLIETVLGGRRLTYRVGAPPGEQPFAWMDPWRTFLRIHSSLVSDLDA